MRTKKKCAVDTAWGAMGKDFPYPHVEPNVVHDPSVCASVAVSKPWPELQDNIDPQLRKFYEREFAHPVVIDDLDVEDMGPFLRGEVPGIVAPEWVQWDVDVPSETDVEEVSEEDP